MKSSKYKLFILVKLVILLTPFNGYYLAQTKNNSIIKLFCLESVKEEMLKAKMEYREEIASKTCDCYYKNFIKTASHQDAKTKCKLEAIDSFES